MRHLFVFSFFVYSYFVAFGQGGLITGKVRNATNNESLEFASVLIQGTGLGSITDSSGSFEIKGLKPGLYNVEARYTGFLSKVIFEVEVTNARVATVNFELEEEDVKAEEVKIVSSPFNKTIESPVSIRTIGVNEIQRSPGGNRDISRVIQSLPGVASGLAFRNDIIIRGGAPNENRFYMDGVEIPNINHFSTQGASGGPVGMINVDFIREVDFFSGAFPATRGNALSSVMEIKLKNGKEDKIGFRATLGSSDLALTSEGPIGKKKKTTFIASARRSYLQGLFTILGLPFLPTYNDFQFKVRTQFNPKNEFIVLGLGAIDQFKLNLKADSTEEQKYILGYLPSNTQWNYTIGTNFRHFYEKGFWSIVGSRNMLNNQSVKYAGNDESDVANKILDYSSQEIENKLRFENTIRLSGYKITAGVSYEFAKYNNSTFNRISTPAGLVNVDYFSEFNMHKYGAFAQAGKSLFKEKLSLSLGLRMDGNSFNKNMANPFRQVSPRFSLAWNFWKNLNLNFNTGIYYQLPPYTVMGFRDNGGSLINQDAMRYIQCQHLIGGLEWNYTATGKITLEAFYKRYNHYPFMLQDSVSLANLGSDFGVVGNGPANANGKGRSYGLEFMTQQKLLKGFYGILSLTLVRSEFTNGTGEYKPSSWDNRYLVSSTLGKKFKRNWEAGLRWRLLGGAPYTPFDLDRSSLISVWDITGRGLPNYALVNSERINPAHQLDIRIDKKYFFKKWSLDLYIDIQNLYNFKAKFQPNLNVEKDAAGNLVADPAKPGYYKMQLIPNTTGTVLPSLGIVVELM